MKLFSAAAVLSLGLIAAPAHAQFLGSTVDNSTVLGGLAGAGIGGALGSNIAGSGNRDEGTAIGALVGGLAGASIGNARSNYYGNPYAGSFNPGFNGRNLIGTGIGAGLGGVIGSNIAGSGVQEEGTALGALIGGVAGYAIANRTTGGAWNGYGGYNAPAYGYGTALPAPVYYSQPAAPVYRPAPVYTQPVYTQPVYTQPVYTRPIYQAPVYRAPTTTTYGGYVAGPVYSSSSTTYVQPTTTVRSLPVVSSRTSHYYSHGTGCHSSC